MTLPVGKLGTREENLTAAFREQTARNPKYLEEWVSTAGRLGKPAQRSPEPARRMPRPRKASTARKKGKPSKGQRLLFPSESRHGSRRLLHGNGDQQPDLGTKSHNHRAGYGRRWRDCGMAWTQVRCIRLRDWRSVATHLPV